MSTSTIKSLLTRTLTSKLEIKREFVPTPLLIKSAQENHIYKTLTIKPSSTSDFTNSNSNHQYHRPRPALLTRLPRKRLTDKYFDRNGQLQAKGIWVRWRQEQITADDGTNIPTPNSPNSPTASASTEGFWEAKLKRGGDFINSRSTEVRGRDAVEDLMAEAGACNSVFDLRFWVGVMADRVCWGVREGGRGQGEGESDDGSGALTLVVDSLLASLEGPEGSHPKVMRHVVGKLELERTVTTNIPTTNTYDHHNKEHHSRTLASASETMNTLLESFMRSHPALFAGEGTPKGKLTACVEQKRARAERDWRANESGRLANLSEVGFERLFGGK